jgi:hypothetical protein
VGKKRRDTTLESEGAEFLVLGNLLIRGISSYKSYRKNAGHDLVAVNPEKNLSTRVEVKSCWASDSHWNMPMKVPGSTDFYVYVRLNRADRFGISSEKAPEFYVFPTKVVDALSKTGWNQARLKTIKKLEKYENAWDLISKKLKIQLLPEIG